jgi:opacity protein-like surface antigen
VGIDGDYTWANLTGHATDISVVNGDIASESSSVQWIATVTGRLGYAANNVLFFAKGGAAWAGFNATSVTNMPGGAFVAQTTSSQTRNGWTVGGGLEWGFAPHWSAKLEYDYVKFATANFSINEVNAAGAFSSPLRSATSSLNMVKAGIAYRDLGCPEAPYPGSTQNRRTRSRWPPWPQLHAHCRALSKPRMSSTL